MKFRITPSEPRKVELSGFDASIYVKQPSYEARIKDHAYYLIYSMETEDKAEVRKRQVMDRIFACICNWEFVYDDDGLVVPFSNTNLRIFLSNYPYLITAIADEMDSEFRQASEATKNE